MITLDIYCPFKPIRKDAQLSGNNVFWRATIVPKASVVIVIGTRYANPDEITTTLKHLMYAGYNFYEDFTLPCTNKPPMVPGTVFPDGNGTVPMQCTCQIPIKQSLCNFCRYACNNPDMEGISLAHGLQSLREELCPAN